MLVMITNRCFENCPHCMENSNPEGQMMDGRTFHKAVMFAKYIGCSVITLSGGEPTTHPDFFKFCKSLNDEYKMPFTVVSNGTWCDDEKIVRQVRRMCSDFKLFIGMQVYTNKLFYKDYDLIHGKKPFFDSFGGKGRKKKCQAIDRWHEKEKNYVTTKLHTYSRMLVDMAVKHRRGKIVLVDQKRREDEAKEQNKNGEPFVLRNWSYYGLKDKIAYKCKMVGIKLEYDNETEK